MKRFCPKCGLFVYRNECKYKKFDSGLRHLVHKKCNCITVHAETLIELLYSEINNFIT